MLSYCTILADAAQDALGLSEISQPSERLLPLRVIMELMTEEQLERYEAFRRAAIDKAKVKRVCVAIFAAQAKQTPPHMQLAQVLNTVAGHTVSEKMVLVMRGMAKVFVGELVEAGELLSVYVSRLEVTTYHTLLAARLIAHEQGDSGPLQPAHYQAAYQQLNHHGKIPHRTSSKRLKL